jgi:hypothetical protein
MTDDIAEAIVAIKGLARLMLPVQMSLAEAELVGEPAGDDAVVLHFMGSGASDQVTAGQLRQAMTAANLFLAKHQPMEET